MKLTSAVIDHNTMALSSLYHSFKTSVKMQDQPQKYKSTIHKATTTVETTLCTSAKDVMLYLAFVSLSVCEQLPIKNTENYAKDVFVEKKN